jgi:uncharacterized protein YkuJ
MELLFKKDKENHNRYNIEKNGEVIYYIIYNHNNKTKELYDITGKEKGKGYHDPSKTHRFLKILIPYILEIPINHQGGIRIEQIVVHYKFIPCIYYFNYNNSTYKAVIHFGVKVSIFLDDVQIAYYVKEELFGDKKWDMKLVLDNDGPAELLCLLSIYLHSNFKDEDSPEGGSSSFALAFQERRFNSNWKPD